MKYLKLTVLNFALATSLGLLGPASHAHADQIIGTGSFSVTSGSTNTLLGIQVGYDDVDNSLTVGSWPHTVLFDIQGSDIQVGKSYVLSSGATFDYLAAHLTDGLNDGITVYTNYGPGYSGGGTLESLLFHNVVVPLYNTPPTADADFYGFTVTDFEFVVSSIDANVPTGWTTVNTSFAVRGLANPIMPVPEPGTFAMFMAGLGLMGFIAARKQRQAA